MIRRSQKMSVGAQPPANFKLVVFDADDTLRKTRSGDFYPVTHQDWVLLPKVRERIAKLHPETRLAIASNQSGVSMGKLTYNRANALLTACADAAFPEKALRLVLFCPHPRQGGCDCRKPQPGMLLQAATAFQVSPEESLFVGDMQTDRDAADHAGFWFQWAHDFFDWPRGRILPRQP